MAAFRDGLHHPEVQRLASLGSWGHYPGNIHGQLTRMLGKSMLPDPLDITIPCLDPKTTAVTEATASILLPHEWFSAMYHHYPAEFHDLIERLWRRIQALYVEEGTEHRMNSFKLGLFVSDTNSPHKDFPVLSKATKAAQVRGLVNVCLRLAQEYCDGSDRAKIRVLMWKSLQKAYEVIDSGGMFLTGPECQRPIKAGDDFLTCCQYLSDQAFNAVPRPKFKYPAAKQHVDGQIWLGRAGSLSYQRPEGYWDAPCFHARFGLMRALTSWLQSCKGMDVMLTVSVVFVLSPFPRTAAARPAQGPPGLARGFAAYTKSSSPETPLLHYTATQQVCWLTFMEKSPRSCISDFHARKLTHAGTGLLLLQLDSRDTLARCFVYAIGIGAMLVTWELVPKIKPFRFQRKRDVGMTVYMIVAMFWFYYELPIRVLAPMFFADPMGAVVGKYLSSNKMWNPVWWRQADTQKTLFGSGAVLFFTVISFAPPATLAQRLAIGAACVLAEALGGAYDNLLLVLSVVGSRMLLNYMEAGTWSLDLGRCTAVQTVARLVKLEAQPHGAAARVLAVLRRARSRLCQPPSDGVASNLGGEDQPHLLVEIRGKGYIEVCGEDVGGVHGLLDTWLKKEWRCTEVSVGHDPFCDRKYKWRSTDMLVATAEIVAFFHSLGWCMQVCSQGTVKAAGSTDVREQQILFRRGMSGLGVVEPHLFIELYCGEADDALCASGSTQCLANQYVRVKPIGNCEERRCVRGTSSW
ncbi:unnamed protein product [Prorocentrum cordatum]|uniref:Uncharacterized protein n=1 Tax=Prorocentrum cordatum TaxID=2364126 RepID=A0ABN9RNL1_9DINO|nr:unnamed protein product [Polarella glacialis]